MNLKTLIFSKNRACQLDLLLQSLTIPASVLFAYDPQFKNGYDLVKKYHPDTVFIKQTNFKSQVSGFVKKSEYVFLPTDDDVMISSFNIKCPEFTDFINDDSIASLSLGLTPQVAGKKWEWNKYRGNYRLRMWGYPVSIDSCILRSEDVLAAIKSYSNIPTPNYLEMALLAKLPNRLYMTCFDKKKIINNSVNQVQKDFPAHTLGVSLDELEKNFLEGKRLSLNKIIEQTKDAKIYRVKIPFTYENP